MAFGDLKAACGFARLSSCQWGRAESIQDTMRLLIAIVLAPLATGCFTVPELRQCYNSLDCASGMVCTTEGTCVRVREGGRRAGPTVPKAPLGDAPHE